jgi:hypothetical protein
MTTALAEQLLVGVRVRRSREFACSLHKSTAFLFQCTNLQIDRQTPGGATASKLSQVL